MRICGIKLTHDGAVAVVEDGRLLFCIEQEKRANNPRYQAITDLCAVTLALAEHGLRPTDVDRFVIDGWDGLTHSQFDVLSEGVPLTIKGAPYIESHENTLLTPYAGSGLVLDRVPLRYHSYAHVAGHVAGAYCTSAFAKARAPALCLVWDGCIFPRLYHVDPTGARFLDTLFPFIGHAYAIAGQHFGPYRQASRAGWDLGVAGKLMAYIGLGALDEGILAVFQEMYEACLAGPSERARAYRASINDPEALLAATDWFFEACGRRLTGTPSEDVLASFHVFLERLLEQEIGLALLRHSGLPGLRHLCIAGGCGLNIKWNSALRATGLFDSVWVPPFPNDSGSAIGAACAAMAEPNALTFGVVSSQRTGLDRKQPIRPMGGFALYHRRACGSHRYRQARSVPHRPRGARTQSTRRPQYYCGCNLQGDERPSERYQATGTISSRRSYLPRGPGC